MLMAQGAAAVLAAAALAATVLFDDPVDPQPATRPDPLTAADPDSVPDPVTTADPVTVPDPATADGPATTVTAPETVTSSTRPPLDDPPDPGPVPDDHGLTAADLAAAVSSSVRVAAPACRGIVREGSGFAVLDGDLIVTNAHLMIGMDEPEIELVDGRILPAVLVAFDPVNDLAVLRAEGAGLAPLPLRESVPDATLGAVLAWEAEGEPDPTPFRIDRPITVRTEIVNGTERIERQSWLLAAQTEVGDSGAALVTSLDGQVAAVGVTWGASRRGGGGVAYATRAQPLQALLDTADLDEPLATPACD